MIKNIGFAEIAGVLRGEKVDFSE